MEKDVYVKIGERLRKQRRIMGLTQEQAAELLGVSTTYYGEIERGNRKLTIPRILTVYEKMNLEPTYLLTGEILTDKVYDEIFDGCPREKEQALILYGNNFVINPGVQDVRHEACADSLDLVCAGCALAQNRRACRLYSNNLYISLFAL